MFSNKIAIVKIQSGASLAPLHSTPHSKFSIGPHVSAHGGLANAPANARRVGATGFGMFVKNQRQWFAPPLAQGEIDAFKSALAENGYAPAQVLPHAGYLINLANPEEDARMASLDSFVAELRRCHALGLETLVVHPGNHLGASTVPDALRRVGESICHALAETEGVRVVLENTAGQGTALGRNLEELAAILDTVENRARVGVCLDTCHAFVSGRDLRAEGAAAKFLDDATRLFGNETLAGFHFNDAQGLPGSRLDRHAPLGEGRLGWDVFQTLLRDNRCANLPLILETPEEDRWPGEIRRLMEMAM